MRLISHRKNFRNRMIVAVAALAVFLLPAFATDVRAADSGAKAADSKWYASFNVPVMFIDDSVSVSAGTAPGPDGTPNQVPYTSNATNEYDTGFRISGAVGYEFGSGLRVEGEVFFARADVSKLTFTGISSPLLQKFPNAEVPPRDIPISGPAGQFGGMLNVWYDFSTASRWKPYLGGGLGFMRVNQGDLEYDPRGPAIAIAEAAALARIPPNLPPQALEPARQQALSMARDSVPPGTIPEVSGTDTGFAYQIGVGLGYEYSDTITFQVGYRLLKTSEFEFTGQNAAATVKATTDLQVHLFEIGIRYRF